MRQPQAARACCARSSAAGRPAAAAPPPSSCRWCRRWWIGRWELHGRVICSIIPRHMTMMLGMAVIAVPLACCDAMYTMATPPAQPLACPAAVALLQAVPGCGAGPVHPLAGILLSVCPAAADQLAALWMRCRVTQYCMSVPQQPAASHRSNLLTACRHASTASRRRHPCPLPAGGWQQLPAWRAWRPCCHSCMQRSARCWRTDLATRTCGGCWTGLPVPCRPEGWQRAGCKGGREMPTWFGPGVSPPGARPAIHW